MPSEAQMIFCTCPNQDTARDIANSLITQQLAACVNIISGVSSVYRWQDQVEIDEECLLIIKSTQSQYSQIEQFIQQQHPYELPEIIAVSVQQGLPGYLAWLKDCVSESL